jgi:hypothetical protein
MNIHSHIKDIIPLSSKNPQYFKSEVYYYIMLIQIIILINTRGTQMMKDLEWIYYENKRYE